MRRWRVPPPQVRIQWHARGWGGAVGSCISVYIPACPLQTSVTPPLRNTVLLQIVSDGSLWLTYVEQTDGAACWRWEAGPSPVGRALWFIHTCTSVHPEFLRSQGMVWGWSPSPQFLNGPEVSCPLCQSLGHWHTTTCLGPAQGLSEGAAGGHWYIWESEFQ